MSGFGSAADRPGVGSPVQGLRDQRTRQPAELPADANVPLPARRPQPADLDPESRRLIDQAARSVPTVSVIVPTRNRGGWLSYVLYALAQQVYPSELVEVIIVDNSSSDDTEQVVRRWAEVHPFRLRFYRKVNEGPAVSRNYGAALASGDVLAFTDSDCMPEANWLLNGVRGLEDGVALVTGPIIPRRTEDTHFFFNSQLGAVLRDDGLYRTASLIVPRARFEAVGGFDESYALSRSGMLLGGEDTDLGWRLKGAGQLALFKPDVVVLHLATPVTPRQWLLRPLLSQTIPKLVRNHPQLRRTFLWHRYFHLDDDFFLLAGAAGVACAVSFGWWPLALAPAGFIWSTRSNYGGMLRKGRLDKAAAVLGLMLAKTALNVGVLAYASVRHRRLVL